MANINLSKHPSIQNSSGFPFDFNSKDDIYAGISNQVFTYKAPWLIYGMGFSSFNNILYRMAIGSFIEDEKNFVTSFLIKGRNYSIEQWNRKIRETMFI